MKNFADTTSPTALMAKRSFGHDFPENAVYVKKFTPSDFPNLNLIGPTVYGFYNPIRNRWAVFDSEPLDLVFTCISSMGLVPMTLH